MLDKRNYSLLSESELREEIKNWTRQDLISWLSWNDPNGIYDDEQSLSEIGYILEKEEAVEIMVNQIIQKN